MLLPSFSACFYSGTFIFLFASSPLSPFSLTLSLTPSRPSFPTPVRQPVRNLYLFRGGLSCVVCLCACVFKHSLKFLFPFHFYNFSDIILFYPMIPAFLLNPRPRVYCQARYILEFNRYLVASKSSVFTRLFFSLADPEDSFTPRGQQSRQEQPRRQGGHLSLPLPLFLSPSLPPPLVLYT